MAGWVAVLLVPRGCELRRAVWRVFQEATRRIK